MRVSKKDLEDLKRLSETMLDGTFSENVSSRASAYLAVESIHQIKNNTKNNILFVILGAV